MPSDAPEQQPAPTRPRTTVRDLIGSLVVLLLVIGAVVGIGRSCSFSPGGPTVDPNAAPTVDVSRELAAAAASVDFAVRRPQLPDGWRANSSATSPVGAGTSVIVRIGWLTPRGGYVQLSQSGGDPTDVVRTETGTDDVRPTGTVDVDSVQWTEYPGRRDEQAWVTALDGVTVLITGSAGADDFRVLASAVQRANPLPRS